MDFAYGQRYRDLLLRTTGGGVYEAAILVLLRRHLPRRVEN